MAQACSGCIVPIDDSVWLTALVTVTVSASSWSLDDMGRYLDRWADES